MSDPIRLRDLDPESELGRALQQAAAPGSTQRIASAWQRLQPDLAHAPAAEPHSHGSGGSLGGSGALGKAGMVIGALVIAGAFAHWATRPGVEPPPPRRVNAAPATSPARSGAANGHEPSTVAAPAQPSLPATPETAVPADRLETPGRTRARPATRVAAADRADQPVRDPAQTAGAQLDAELALLSRAEQALPRSPARALDTLAEHERLFPHGLLVEEREVLRIDAERALGRAAPAAERARAFVARFPRSPQRPRLEAWLQERDASDGANNSSPERIPSE